MTDCGTGKLDEETSCSFSLPGKGIPTRERFTIFTRFSPLLQRATENHAFWPSEFLYRAPEKSDTPV